MIVGDIGTGTDAAAAVLLAALRMKPDAILHLGDIYYSGTDFETRHRFLGLIRAVSRAAKHRAPVFTVPGNHEYFTGCVSYLAALDSGRLAVVEDQRQAASYFCLRTIDDGWQFLGLDTGYHGHYMNVPAAAQQAVVDRLQVGKVEASGDASDEHWPSDRNPYFRLAGGADLPVLDTTAPVAQVTVRGDEAVWHRDKLDHFKGRSMLLSHHQLYSALGGVGVDATAQSVDAHDCAWVNTALWRQFGSSFGDQVVAWIWGHEHNLEIFESAYRPPAWPSPTGPEDPFQTLPKGRCAGHAAIPVRETEKPYDQKYAVPLEQPNLSLGITDGWYHHGFELLELDGAGRPASLTYYEVAGTDPTPRVLFQELVDGDQHPPLAKGQP